MSSSGSEEEVDYDRRDQKRSISSDSEDEGAARGAGLWNANRQNLTYQPSAATASTTSSQSTNSSASGGDLINNFILPKKRKGVFTDDGYSDFSKKMMKTMGYKEGAGLGVQQQGIAEPVKLVAQSTRRGLGNVVAGFEADEDIEWNYDTDPVSIDEHVDWLEYSGPDDLNEVLAGEISIGSKKEIIDDEVEFCDENLLQKMLKSKTLFDEFEERLMVDARAKSNPYELIAAGIFQNRAAMKMANIDHVTNFAFSNHHLLKSASNGTQADGSEASGSASNSESTNQDILYFADVCAGPGGFSEYMLWRRKTSGRTLRTKGFGFTLVGDCDFKLAEFSCGDAAFFEPYYGPHGDGNVYKPDNLTAFRQLIMTETNGHGLHFVMADGGFSVAGEENIQEIRSKRLYLCQLLVALMCVREGGHFVCKLFDLFTPFSVALLYCAYRSFERIAIFKPITSRPANSERYLLGFSLRKQHASRVAQFLYRSNNMFERLSDGEDIQELLPLATLQGDANFFDYLVESNNVILDLQIRNLQKIRVFAKNRDLRDTRQMQLRDDAFKLWNVPNEPRRKPMLLSHPNQVREEGYRILRDIQAGRLLLQCTPFDVQTLYLPDKAPDTHSYRCTFVSFDFDASKISRHYFVYGQGGSNVWIWSGRDNEAWRMLNKEDGVTFELPKDTMLECEFVEEVTGEKTSANIVDHTVHIIDAVQLGGVDLSTLDFDDRQNEIRYFCDLINKPSQKFSIVRPKKWCTLQELPATIGQLASMRTKRQIRPSKHAPVFTSSYDRACEVIAAITRKFVAAQGNSDQPSKNISGMSKIDRSQPWFLPSGCIFVRVVNPGWMLGWSKTRKEYYYYCAKSRSSVPRADRSRVTSIDTTFVNCLKSRSGFRFENKFDKDGPSQLLEIMRSFPC